MIKRLTNTWQTLTFGNGTRHFPYAATTVEESYELNNGLLTTRVTTTQAFDDYGNPTEIAVSTDDGYDKTTVNTYADDLSAWRLGRLTQSKVTAVSPGHAAQTRISSFAYDPATGLLSQEVVEPGSALALTTVYQRDSFGNEIRATTTGADIEERYTRREFSSAGRFPIRAFNSLEHKQQRSFDAGFGTVVSLTDENGLQTTWAYDSLGRKTTESRPDGSSTTWIYAYCGTGCPSLAAYSVQVNESPGNSTLTFFDSLGREIRTETYGFDGRRIAQETKYDALGRMIKVSRPYFEDEQRGDVPGPVESLK